jgi:hypothetical protein
MSRPFSFGISACLVTITLASPLRAQQFAEVKVSSFGFGDIEFDSARDGIYCSICNFGQGNSRFNWTDINGNLWIAHVDPQTGAVVPANGKAELVDTNAAYWKDFGNGPEWAFSTQGSELLYTRYQPGMPRTSAFAGAALATMINGAWTADFLPGAINTDISDGSGNSALPEASQASESPMALVVYKNLAQPQQMFWQQASLTADPPQVTPFGSYSNGISERWVPQTHQLVFLGAAPPDAHGRTYQQVFWFDADTNVVEQLTTDPTQKDDAFMFQAPELNDAYVFFTVSALRQIAVYEQTGTNGDGSPIFQLINTIKSADPAQPLISGTEPFINCTPTCQSYIFMTLTANYSALHGGANGLAVTSIDPSQPMFTLLTAGSPARIRYDPEYFVTQNGPYIYYGRSKPATATTGARYEGQYYIDMGLGAPSGPCVGSSAQGGMMPGC